MPIIGPTEPASLAAAEPPRLIVIVDTEEEFDWSRPLARSETSVTHVRHQDRALRIFDRFALRPSFVVDYAVATQEAGYRPLREWLVDGRCGIGAHLHPWVNPPFEEEISARNSYPGNLPEPLERAKLARLTEAIAANFQYQPTVYRAGRYGIGPATSAILGDLGYEIDTSIAPRTDFGGDGGPDFGAFDADPFWFGPAGRLLEVPLSAGWVGRLSRCGSVLQPPLMSRTGLRWHLPGIFARLGLFERIRLTPEGIVFAELKRLTDAMLARGRRIFCLSFHSPSLVPGHTPYVRNEGELQQFLKRIEQYCEYFFGERGGAASTPQEIRTLLTETASSSPRRTEGALAQ